MDREVLIKQLATVCDEYQGYIGRSQHDDGSDVISESKVHQLTTRAIAAIERATGRQSVYFQQTKDVVNPKDHLWANLAAIIGVTESAKLDLQDGYLAGIEELIHFEVFSDFLEMADYLQQNGYKDASAVIAGSTLEVHLRQLCGKHKINTENNNKPKKADTLNSELAKDTVYSKLDQKSVTAWLGLRNNAAHGNYTEYTDEQVKLLVVGIRDFMIRNPA